MDRGVKLIAATAVLLVGLSVAWMYRRQLPPPLPVAPGEDRSLVLRQWTGPQTSQPRSRATNVTNVPAVAGLPATIRAPAKPDRSPPRLARVYPNHAARFASQGSPSLESLSPRSLSPESPPIGYRLPRPRDSRPATRIHKIVDGDTLVSLAKRYLGDPERRQEIYRANRDVLSSPDALPIGIELKIPPRPAPGAPAEEILPERPLVPVEE